MARLLFGGLKNGHGTSDGFDENTGGGGAFSADTTRSWAGNAISRRAAWSGSAGPTANLSMQGLSQVAGRTYYWRFVTRLDALPTSATRIRLVRFAIGPTGSNVRVGGVWIDNTGKLSPVSTGAQTAEAMTAGQWAVVEVAVTMNNPGMVCSVRLNGGTPVTFSDTTSTGTIERFAWGALGDASWGATNAINFDAWGVNDSTGATDNSWIGTSEVVTYLYPTADLTVGADWTGHDAAGAPITTNLWDVLNDAPPLANPPATTSYAEDGVNNGASPAADLDLTLQSYTAAGIAASDTIVATRLVGMFGDASNTTTVGAAVRTLSNPTDATETQGSVFNNGGSVFNFTWTRIASPLQSRPTVVKGTAPTARMAKRAVAGTDLTRVLLAATLFLAVASTPPAAAGQTISPTGIPSAEAFGTPTVTRGAPPAQTVSPTGIPSGEAFGTPTVTVAPGPAQTISPTGIPSGEAFGTPTVTQPGPGQTISPAGIPSAEAFGTPTVTAGSAPIIADGGTPLFVELTTLHYPGTPAKVLAVCQQYDDLEVAIPLNDMRTGKVTLSIYDDVLGKVRDYLDSLGEDELAYIVKLRVRYYGLPVLWGAITLPDWKGGEAKVTLNAVGPELRLQHHFLKDGDPTGDGPLSEEGKYPMATEGLRLLLAAARNEPSDDSHGVPDLGIVDGSSAIIPPELSPIPQLPFRRHDEVWRAMQELRAQELAPDMEIAPTLDVPGAYARLNCAFPQGTDRSSGVKFYYGFARDNLDDFNATPGGKLITRQTYVSSDDKVRKRATAWDSAALRGIYGAVEPTDYSSNGDSIGEALTLKAKLEVRKYREPPRYLSIKLKPEAAISDPHGRFRYGRDFLVGDIVHVEAKKGWMRYSGPARVTKVTLRRSAGAPIVPELELVPDVGDGTPETGDG